MSRRNGFCLLAAILVVAASIASTVRAAAQTEKIIHQFGVKAGDGSVPYAGLVFDSHGNLFGTTSGGGANGLGAVFELTPAKTGGWVERVIYSFGGGLPKTQWAMPEGTLILDSAGNLYGTTTEGVGTVCCGTVFELKHWPSGGWTHQRLFTFDNSNGARPIAALLLDGSGNLYGTSPNGGSPGGGQGAVFELTPSADGTWSESLLHSFAAHGDGAIPDSNLIADAAGNLYGTTQIGGAHSFGTVFKMTPDNGGWTVTILHSFQGTGPGGLNPHSGLIFDASGNLYGTTAGVGTGTRLSGGTVFELMPAADGEWTEKVLYTFGTGTDGSEPLGNLVMDAAGNLYGTTNSGGTYGGGTAFKLTPRQTGPWHETILHSFGNGEDGNQPMSALVLDRAGNLYGTTFAGGAFQHGIVFEIIP